MPQLKSANIPMILNATPLTKEGLNNMIKSATKNQHATRDDFLKNCYVEPDFVSHESLKSKKLNWGDTENTEDYPDDYDYLVRLKSSKLEKNRFIKSLYGRGGDDSTPLVNTVFLIEGPAGCGKTTYGNKLLNKNFEYRIVNIENATDTSYRFVGQVHNIERATPIETLKGIIINEINIILRKNFDNDVEEQDTSHRDRISKIWSKYVEHFGSNRIEFLDSWEFQWFFSIVKYYVYNNEINYEYFGKSLHYYLTIMLDKDIKNIFFSEYRNNSVDGSINFYELYSRLQNSHPKSHVEQLATEGDDSVVFLFGVLMRLNFCLSRIDEDIHDNPPKRVLFLDNFEKYIYSEKDRPFCSINDTDLQKIIASIYIAAEGFESATIRIFNQLRQKHKTSFAILVALRETTVDLIRNIGMNIYFNRQYADNLPVKINITNWFNFKDIVNRKIAYFGIGLDGIRENRKKHSPKFIEELVNNEVMENPILRALNYIMSDVDEPSRWGLKNLLVSLYNDNYRRFAFHLSSALFNYENEVIMFNKNWENSRGSKKHLYRMLILSIVFNYMQNYRIGPHNKNGFFDMLMLSNGTKTAEAQRERVTFLRRTLLTLDNREKDSTIDENNKSLSFPEIIKILMHCRIEKLTSEKYSSAEIGNKIDDLATICKIASESAMIATNGVELISISVDRNKLGEISLADEMKRQWDIFLERGEIDPRFKIRITRAGSALAQFLPCFEFFSCRYKRGLKITEPLLLTKSESQRKMLLFGDGDGMHHVGTGKNHGIVDMAFWCADESISVEENLLSRGMDKPFNNPEWLYKNNKNSKGMIHAVNLLNEHLQYLIAYRKFLSEFNEDEKREYNAEKYKSVAEYNIPNMIDIKSSSLGVVELAIAQYNEKLNCVLREHKNYTKLGIIPRGVRERESHVTSDITFK